MAAMFEGDTFVKGAQQVAFIMPPCKAIEPATLMRAVPAAVEERVKHRIVRGDSRLAYERIDLGKGIAFMAVAFDQGPDIPLQIGRRGGAVVHVGKSSGAEGCDHEHIRIVRGCIGKNLVD